MLKRKLLLFTLLAIATMLCASVRFAAAADSSTPTAKPAAPASSDTDTDNLQAQESDPLEPFNSAMFTFNLKVDDWVLHPVASGYAKVLPTSAREAVGRALDNVLVIPRFANNLFQLRVPEAGGEVARFGINTTAGLLGFFDPADKWFGLKEHPDDFGLTLRYYRVPTGPYLMLPFFGPSTAGDTVGLVADGFMEPLSYFVPWYVSLAAGGGQRIMEAVNYRSLHLDQFEQADRYAIDLYGAVQDYYLQSRNNRVKDLKTGAD
ncbi:MAG TPA: VacJ family lipoprotein [Candidatus Binataceae bacterium]|nr:VacJ family lipoprotein [Candidatus Binataceae bacterium]